MEYFYLKNKVFVKTPLKVGFFLEIKKLKTLKLKGITINKYFFYS